MSEKQLSKQIMYAVLVFVLISVLMFGVKFMIAAHDRGYLTPENLVYDVSELEIIVYCDHIIYSADYSLYIDGERVEQFRMNPGEYSWFLYDYRALKWEDSYYITVKVVSTGGGLGSVTDEISVLVGTGQNYKIKLYA